MGTKVSYVLPRVGEVMNTVHHSMSDVYVPRMDETVTIPYGSENKSYTVTEVETVFHASGYNVVIHIRPKSRNF